MHFPEGLWASIIHVVGFFSSSTLDGPITESQMPLRLSTEGSHVVNDHNKISEELFLPEKGPVFTPPSASTHGEASKFVCEYPEMIGWVACSTPEDRTCWLKKKGDEYGDEGISRFDIHTDYEKDVPKGIERFYEMDATDGSSINLDGIDFPEAKLFDRKYPGPWIQACWGDVSMRASYVGLSEL